MRGFLVFYVRDFFSVQLLRSVSFLHDFFRTAFVVREFFLVRFFYFCWQFFTFANFFPCSFLTSVSLFLCSFFDIRDFFPYSLMSAIWGKFCHVYFILQLSHRNTKSLHFENWTTTLKGIVWASITCTSHGFVHLFITADCCCLCNLLSIFSACTTLAAAATATICNDHPTWWHLKLNRNTNRTFWRSIAQLIPNLQRECLADRYQETYPASLVEKESHFRLQ